jgi:NAD(P)H-dependent FMN reductase
MKIIAFAGSNSQQSINRHLAAYAANQFENAEIEVLDLNDFEMPLFSVDLEKETGQHETAKSFLKKIESADILVVSLAENNGNYSVAFKNIFDWSSRIIKDVFQQKPMLLMATSPGTRGGASVLEIAKNCLPKIWCSGKRPFFFTFLQCEF